MKGKIILPSALLLLAVSLHWAGRLGNGASLSRDPATPASSLAPTLAKSPPLTSSHAGRQSALDPEKLRRLLADTTALMEASAGLSSDRIDEFQRLCELTNEFSSRLDTEMAALLVQHMPAGFLATPWGDQALRRWALADRAAAAEWMAAHPDPSPIAAGALAQGWFTSDREGLRAYVVGLPEGGWKANVSTAAGEDALVAKQPAEAVDLLNLSDTAPPRRQELYEWAAIQWGVSDYEQASGWAAQATTQPQRDRLLAAVNIGYANTDPLAAADALLAKVKDAEVVAPALGSIVRIWAAKEPGAAAKWVEAFPSGPEKERAIEQLLAVWSLADANSASTWQSGLSDENSRHHAAQVLAEIKAEREEPGSGIWP